MRKLGVTVVAVVMLGLAACGGGDKKEPVAAINTTAASSVTTAASRPTTTVDAGIECLTAEEMTALTGKTPDVVKKPYATGCRYEWTASNTGISVQQNHASNWQKTIERSKNQDYTEYMPSPGLGVESQMTRSTGSSNLNPQGLNAIIRVLTGDEHYYGFNYADLKNFLRPTLAESTTLAIAVAKAHVDKYTA